MRPIRKFPVVAGIIAGLFGIVVGSTLLSVGADIELFAYDWRGATKVQTPIPVDAILFQGGGWGLLGLGAVGVLAAALGLVRPGWARFVLLRDGVLVVAVAIVCGLAVLVGEVRGAEIAPFLLGPMLAPAVALVGAGLLTPRTTPASRQPSSQPSAVTSQAQPDGASTIAVSRAPAVAAAAAATLANPLQSVEKPAVEPGVLTPRAKFCMQCGHALKPGARFCVQCGSPVPDRGQARTG
jgi:hypothetical protein